MRTFQENRELANFIRGVIKLILTEVRAGTINLELARENVLDSMGQTHVGGAKRKEPYGDTYVGFSSGKEEDSSGRARQAGIVKLVNKNLNKKLYSLHNPPSMGISMERKPTKE